MPIKKVYVNSYHPIAVHRKYSVPWCDIWLRFHAQRKSMRTAPTLRSATDLKSSIELDAEFANDYPEYREETFLYIARCENILSFLKIQPFYCDDENESQPDIFTAKDFIDRDEAEAMIDYYLSLLGIRSAVQKWKNPGGLISRPVSVLGGMIL